MAMLGRAVIICACVIRVCASVCTNFPSEVRMRSENLNGSGQSEIEVGRLAGPIVGSPSWVSNLFLSLSLDLSLTLVPSHSRSLSPSRRQARIRNVYIEGRDGIITRVTRRRHGQRSISILAVHAPPVEIRADLFV